MNPFFHEEDKAMFYKYLDRSTVYFEFGCGGSTYQASIRDNIKKIYSVESDIQWQRRLKSKIKHRDIKYIYNDLNTRPNTWGYPGRNATNQQKINYSNHMKNLGIEKQQEIDMVFIDGRFRVACCLKCFDIIKDDCVVLFDDFLFRKHYHIVLNYFNIIEQTKSNSMVVLKKKDNISVPEDVIKKYELIPN